MLHGVEKRPFNSGELSADLKGTDVLVHLAWSSQPADSMVGMVEDANKNIVGSLKLFAAAARANVSRIIFASSGGAIYGNTDKLPILEGLSPNPVSAYGVSKVAVERYLQLVDFHHGLTGISLRIGNPYGPYQLVGTPIGLIASFIRQIRADAPLRIYGDGRIVRDYIWIGDVANAIVAAATTDMKSGEYNIGSGEGRSINEIADLVEAALGRSTSRVYFDHRSFDARQVILSTEKFRHITGWRPEISLTEGLQRMVNTAPGTSLS